MDGVAPESIAVACAFQEPRRHGITAVTMQPSLGQTRPPHQFSQGRGPVVGAERVQDGHNLGEARVAVKLRVGGDLRMSWPPAVSGGSYAVRVDEFGFLPSGQVREDKEPLPKSTFCPRKDATTPVS